MAMKETSGVQTVKSPLRRRCLGLVLLAAVSLLYGGLLTFLTYPGIFYSDSYTRAKLAIQLAQGADRAGLGSFLSLLPQVIIEQCLKLTGSLASYTVLQAAGFAAAILLALFYFFPKRAAAVLSVLALACPLVFGYAVYWETGVVTAACLLLLAMAADKFRRCGKTPGSLLLAALCFFCLTFLLVGYRLNAATAVVGVILCEVWAAVRRTQPVQAAAVKTAALVLGIVLAMRVPQMMGMQKINNGVVGPMWETACMLNRIGAGNGYDDYMDDLLGEGGTSKIFAVTDTPEDSMYAFSDSMPYWDVPWSPYTSGQYLQRYKTLAMQKPGVFLRVKWEMAKRTLGTLPFAEYEYNENGGMQELGLRDTPQRQGFYAVVTGFAAHCRWMRTPWAVLLTAAVLLVLCRARQGGTRQAGKLFFTALCYEGAFFITTQSHEFRYWFPALVLLLFSIGLSVRELLGTVRKNRK